MATQTFNLSLPKELVKKLDEQAKRDFSTRSDYVRKAILNQLKREQALQSKAAPAAKKTKNADNNEVITAAKKILKDYREDFENLAKR